MKLIYQYMVIFFNFSPTSSHLHPLQVENCDSNSRLVVDENANGKLERVNKHVISLVCTSTEIISIKPCHPHPFRSLHFFNFADIKSTPDENGLMEVNVTDLRPHSRYRLRMRAENELGTSYPSDETGVDPTDIDSMLVQCWDSFDAVPTLNQHRIKEARNYDTVIMTLQ